MPRKLRILMLLLLCLPPLAVQAQTVEKPTPLSETAYPYVIGLGAIAGIVATQGLLFGAAGFPFFAGSVASDSVIAAEVSVGISRMYAVTSAVTGAWIANWLYDH
jgi:hypothetical protein